MGVETSDTLDTSQIYYCKLTGSRGACKDTVVLLIKAAGEYIWYNKQISETARNFVWNLPALFGASHSWYRSIRCHTNIARLVKAKNSILGKDATLQRKWCNVSTVLLHRKNLDIVLSHHVKFITKLVKFASASWM